jgi:molybdopterin/thiamine biosynthesis adenylyltransferase
MRYSRNGILSDNQMDHLKQSKICIVGCGGLGGYVIEMLARLGVGHLTLVDGDVFDESNLNRQLLSTEQNIGQLKVEHAKERLDLINSSIHVCIHDVLLNKTNVHEIIKGHDVVIDAVDSIGTRLLMEDTCEDLRIPMVHGAIAGWYGQVCTILPGDQLLRKLYKTKKNKGIEEELGNPSFTPATIASIQVAEVVKLLIGEEIIRHQVLFIDLKYNDFETIEMS